MKKTLIASLLPLALFVSHQSFAADDDDVVSPIDDVVSPITVNGGVVNFTGSIVNAPCAVDNSSAAQTVELGQYRVADFTATGDTTGAKSFNIGLSNCAVDVYSKASVTFNGNTASGNNSALAVEGGAGGVGIQILRNGTSLALDGSEAADAASLIEGSNNIAFQAQYIALADTVTPGAANASADFTITYQ